MTNVIVLPENPAQVVNKRFLYSDILRIVAVIAVIFIHAAAPMLYKYNDLPHRWWWIANIFDSGTRWCVPIFIMLSGRLLLDPNKSEGIWVFLKKRLVNVLVPLICWSIFYVIYNAGFDLSKISLVGTALKIIKAPVYYHLWFLYALIPLYLATPVLRLYVAKASRANFIYFLVLWFAFSVVLPILVRFTPFRVGIDPQFFVGYIGYYLLGYLMGTVTFSRRIRYLIYTLGVLGLAITIVGTCILTVKNAGVLDEYFYGNLSPNVVFMASAVFELFKSIAWEKYLQKAAAVQKALVYLGRLSFGIYFIHPVILKILANYQISAGWHNPLIGIPLTVLLTYIISGAIIAVLRLIPYAKKVIG